MHEARLKQLRKLSFQKVSSGSELLAKIRAMDSLTREDGRIPVDQFTEILTWACENPYGSWEGSRAASMAGQLLDFIQRTLADNDLEYPSEHPEDLAPVGYWPYDGSQPDLEAFEAADSAVDTMGDRDRWRENLFGPSPWRRDAPEVDYDERDVAEVQPD